jgi:thioesterase domain-containing protein
MIPDEHNQDHPSTASSVALVLPCSLAQQRFWFLEQFEPGNPALNVAVRWQMQGIVSDSAVEFAVQTLIDRHEILRTQYSDLDGVPQQNIYPSLPCKITRVDLSRLKSDQRGRDVEAISLREAQRPFDLAAAPPVRFAMLQLDERNIVILLTMHHIATDGWTMGVLAHEFGALIAQAMSGKPAELPTIDMQFGDYALWQSDMLANAGYDSDASYWRSTLANLPRFEVAPDKPRPPKLGTAGDFRLRNIPPALMDPVEALARRQGQTMYMLAASALAMALSAETGKTDVIMGTQVAGREDMLLEPIAGLFINTLVLRFDLANAKTGRAINETCRRAIDGAMAHQKFPFEKLVEMLNPPRDASRTPLFSVNFTLIRPVIQSERFDDIELISLASQMTGAQYDLLFFMVKRADGWRMVCESSSALYETSTPDRILARWEGAFRQLLEASDETITAWTGLDKNSVDAATVPSPIQSAATSPEDPDLATAVTNIWRECLGHPALGPNANFFESGGHSLLALRMLARVRAFLNESIPVARLFENPVLADFIASLAPGSTKPNDPQIAHIQSTGSRPPVIVLNDGAVYHAVARQLGPDRPFIDIHLADANERTLHPDEQGFEGVAADAVRLIKRAQPVGPYTLMGHCIFGAIAYEAAQQLRRSGDTVSLVVMLDTLAPGFVEDMPWHDRLLRRLQLLGSSGRYFMELVGKLRSGDLSMQSVLFQYGFIRRNGILRLLENIGIVTRVAHTPEEYAEIVFGNRLLDARRNYRLKPYAGDVLQFRAETARHGRLFDKGFGWSRWIAGDYSVVEVPSDHFNMMRDPAAAVIAAHITQSLTEIETQAATR